MSNMIWGNEVIQRISFFESFFSKNVTLFSSYFQVIYCLLSPLLKVLDKSMTLFSLASSCFRQVLASGILRNELDVLAGDGLQRFGRWNTWGRTSTFSPVENLETDFTSWPLNRRLCIHRLHHAFASFSQFFCRWNTW